MLSAAVVRSFLRPCWFHKSLGTARSRRSPRHYAALPGLCSWCRHAIWRPHCLISWGRYLSLFRLATGLRGPVGASGACCSGCGFRNSLAESYSLAASRSINLPNSGALSFTPPILPRVSWARSLSSLLCRRLRRSASVRAAIRLLPIGSVKSTAPMSSSFAKP
jgi:hypothetical protein